MIGWEEMNVLKSLCFFFDEFVLFWKTSKKSGVNHKDCRESMTPATATAKLMEKFELSPSRDMPAEAENGSSDWAVGHDYRVEDKLGTGSYGDVAKATHVPTGTTVAIKRVYNVFQHERDARYVSWLFGWFAG